MYFRACLWRAESSVFSLLLEKLFAIVKGLGPCRAPGYAWDSSNVIHSVWRHFGLRHFSLIDTAMQSWADANPSPIQHCRRTRYSAINPQLSEHFFVTLVPKVGGFRSKPPPPLSSERVWTLWCDLHWTVRHPNWTSTMYNSRWLCWNWKLRWWP